MDPHACSLLSREDDGRVVHRKRSSLPSSSCKRASRATHGDPGVTLFHRRFAGLRPDSHAGSPRLLAAYALAREDDGMVVGRKKTRSRHPRASEHRERRTGIQERLFSIDILPAFGRSLTLDPHACSLLAREDDGRVVHRKRSSLPSSSCKRASRATHGDPGVTLFHRRFAGLRPESHAGSPRLLAAIALTREDDE